jgi:hypothetical protein
MTITNVETGELISAQFNPDELSEKLEASYNEPEIVGHSHQPLQFKSTKNLALSFTMVLDGMSLVDNENGDRLDDHRNFIHSLFYPMRSGAGTPRVLLVYPKIYSIVCRAKSLDGNHKRMSKTGRSTLYEMKISWSEVLVRKLYSEDVRIVGTLRS